MLKKLVISSLVLSSLVGCGGGSDGEDSTNNQVPIDPSATVYKVIDGYLGNVEVCLIRPNSNTCDVIGTTNENGEIALPDNAEGTLVAKVVAGQSTDSDIAGFVANSYEMIAEISNDKPNVITPFTTLDVLDESRTMVDIAAELNLPESLISGDYIASTDSQQPHAYILARFMASQLATQYSANDINAFSNVMFAANTHINNGLLNDGVDLAQANIQIQYGEFVYSQLIPTLQDYLQGPLYMASTTLPSFAREGVREVVFDNGVVTLEGNSQNYTVDGNTLNLSEGGDGDLFLYVTDKFSLSIPLSDKDLVIMSPIKFGYGQALWLESDGRGLRNWDLPNLAGETRFLLFDDAGITDSDPSPSLVKIEFLDSENARLTENGEQINITWSYDTMDDQNFFTKSITLHMGSHNDRDIHLFELFSDGNISIIDDRRSVSPPQLMFKDEALATTIYNKWKSVQ